MSEPGSTVRPSLFKVWTYYGHEAFIDPRRVLFVEDVGCGSREACVRIHFDTGKTLDVGDVASDLQRRIAEAANG